MRKSNVLIHTRITDAGRELPAAKLPSGRVTVQSNGTILFYADADACPLEEDWTKQPNHRAGVLYRREDQSGVSGTGVVADFAEFPSGYVVQEWRNENNPGLDAEGPLDSGVDFRPSMSLAVQIHGHNGRTEYVYDNGEIAGTKP